MHRIIVIGLALCLGACTTGLTNPFVGGHFSSDIWKADLAIIKDAARQGGQAALDTMDALCPEIPTARAIISDPTTQAGATAVFGSQNNATKATNNINDALMLLSDACAVRNADSARKVIVAGAQAINDARTILAASKGAK